MKDKIYVKGMSCNVCEEKIEAHLNKVTSILNVSASFKENSVEVEYDEKRLSIEEIKKSIEEIGYEVSNQSVNKVNKFGYLIIGVVIAIILLVIFNKVDFNDFPQVTQNMSFGMLFIVGILTSVHCVAMCGGINISQCVDYSNNGKSKIMPSFLYNFGRLISYTLIGGIIGLLGKTISLTVGNKGLIAIVVGIFMLIMGINMLNIFPKLKKLNFRLPRIIKLDKAKKYGPFIVGILNGFMPCGPLQSMQIYALGTSSFVLGAASMFFFSLGTIPLMFMLGVISTMLNSKTSRNIMKISATVVIVLGIIMIGRGMALSGISLNTEVKSNEAIKNISSFSNIAKIENGVQKVTTELKNGSYYPIIVQKGIPVEWTVRANSSQLNGCNNTIEIPKYKIESPLSIGDTVIKFTPEESGNLPYSCWMGMITSSINVVDDLSSIK